jgi:hypothetical protein
VDRASSTIDGFLEDNCGRFEDAARLGPCYPEAFPVRVDPGFKKNFRDIDIPDPTRDLLVEENRPDRTPGSPDTVFKLFGPDFENIGAGRLKDPGKSYVGLPLDSSETSGIPVRQEPLAFGGLKSDGQMGMNGCLGGLEGELGILPVTGYVPLPRHAESGQERPGLTGRRFHGEKKNFPDAAQVGKLPSRKIRYVGQEDFWIRAAPERAHTGSQKNGKKLFADCFGFWKFWHEDILAWSLADKSSPVYFKRRASQMEFARSMMSAHYDEKSFPDCIFVGDRVKMMSECPSLISI